MNRGALIFIFIAGLLFPLGVLTFAWHWETTGSALSLILAPPVILCWICCLFVSGHNFRKRKRKSEKKSTKIELNK